MGGRGVVIFLSTLLSSTLLLSTPSFGSPWEFLGESLGVPKEALEKRREEKSRVEKRREEGELSPSEESRMFFEEEPFRNKVIVYFTDERGVPKDFIAGQIPKFISYWTEPNKSGSQQRWELERTFEIKRRLLTWFSRASQYEKERSNRKAILT